MSDRRSGRSIPGRIVAGIVVAAAIALGVIGCKDTCADIVCGPAPPLITVTLLDTVMIDTTITVTVPDSTDSTRFDSVRVDTTLGVIRIVTGPTISVAQISGSDTVIFDTLAVSDQKYYKYDSQHLPVGHFSLVARNAARLAVQHNLELKQVDGCCSYPVVGVYTMQLR